MYRRHGRCILVVHGFYINADQRRGLCYSGGISIYDECIQGGTNMTTILLILLSLLGWLDSLYLTILHTTGTDGCGVGGCSDVLGSAFSTLFGLPISVFGLLLFGYVGISALLSRKEAKSVRLESAYILLLVASIIELVLIGLQAFVIRSFCPFCLVAAGLIFAMIIVLIPQLKKNGALSLHVIANRSNLALFGVMVLVSLSVWATVTVSVKQTAQVPSENTEFVLGAVNGDILTFQDIRSASSISYETALVSLAVEKKAQLLSYVIQEEAKKQEQFPVKWIQIRLEKPVPLLESEADILEKNPSSDTLQSTLTTKIVKRMLEYRTNPEFDPVFERLIKDYRITFQGVSSLESIVNENPYGSLQKGSSDASVRIIKFYDLECPSCRHVHEFLEKLQAKYPKKVAIEYRYFPLKSHSSSQDKAKTLECIRRTGNGLPALDALFANQKGLKSSDMPAFAKRFGLDNAAYEACINAPETSDAVAFDVLEGEMKGINSTPTLFINNKYFRSADGVDYLKQLFNFFDN